MKNENRREKKSHGRSRMIKGNPTSRRVPFFFVMVLRERSDCICYYYFVSLTYILRDNSPKGYSFSTLFEGF